ncbi:hypothetical protein FQN53_005854 [Emmonsiellopsis sp. PD_33]|nr:hypothetical protein FQN53_005854 [Emmonsiellopsis sp. PD_33]
MAPVIPKRKAAKSALRKPSSSTTTTATATSTFSNPNPGPFPDTFRTTKKDKRTIKHSVLLSKIEKSRSKPLKRRRPSKKLVANLDSLVDALPDAGDAGASNNQAGDAGVSSQVNIIKHKSLKHKPGAMKRKEKLDRLERERFAKNLAQMAGSSSSSGQGESQAQAQTQAQTQVQPSAEPTANRWAALRSFITQTMDQNPEFKAGRGT